MDVYCDYSFLHLGSLYDATIEAVMEACRRFGAEKAMSVLSVARFEGSGGGLSAEALKLEILNETGVEITDGDVAFLGAVVQAETQMKSATALLREAGHGKS